MFNKNKIWFAGEVMTPVKREGIKTNFTVKNNNDNEYMDIIMMGDLSYKAEKDVKVGNNIFIEGKIQTREKICPGNIKKPITKILAHDFEII